MRYDSARRIAQILDLERRIIGIKFIDYKSEFDELKIEKLKGKGTVCFMARKAMEGNMFKVDSSSFASEYGAYALGIMQPDTSITEGRSYNACGLYESLSISRSITESMCYLKHNVYGAAMGPLEKMESADVVIIIGMAEQMMRVIQGYAYKFGMPTSIRTIGNQAMCSDLISKPFTSGDINLSLMCKGARQYAQCHPGEVGIGFPINLFESISEGIMKTVNPVSSNKEKDAILQRLDSDDDFKNKITKDSNYGKYLKEYDTYVQNLEK